MANEFSISPTLEADFPKQIAVWTCPITGIDVPKNPVENLQWRAKILEAAETDRNLRTDLYTACSKSLLFWVNAFGWTLRVFEPGEGGKSVQAKDTHIPFVTWPIQDRHMLRLNAAIQEGEDLLTDKSRDMGATWNHITVLTWRFLFRPSESFLLISRKEAAVDQLDALPKRYPFGPLADPGTLFGKIDYILNRLPSWMLPKLARKKLHLVNLDNSSRLDGESANASAGSSDRRKAILLDEMAKMPEGESIKRSTRDVSACRLPCSTPNGAGTAFSKWRLSGQIPVFILAWWEHPEKGKGRYIQEDENKRFKIKSPWYNREEEVRTPKEMAIEIDMDHVGSGDTFFEAAIIEEHKLMFSKKATRKIAIAFDKAVPEADIPAILVKKDCTKIRVTNYLKSPWQIWGAVLNGRLDQSKTYILACDISMGMGASNSTCSVMCVETGEKVAAFADANTAPHAFARLMCAACLWVGGRVRPLLIWENNGNAGFDFNNQIMKTYQYPRVFFDRQDGVLGEKIGKRWGWRSNPEKKAIALGMLRRAYAHGGFINHDAMALDEALSYIQFENGGIGPAVLVEESENARKAHGDRVIADALCLVGAGSLGKIKAAASKNPTGSIGYRFKKRQQAKGMNKKKTQFSFTS